MHAKAAFCSNTSLSADRDDIPYSLVVETSAPSVFDPNRLSQHKVFENELSIPTGKWCSARPTRHVVVNRLRSTFAFHDLIERLAFRACEGVTQHIAVPIRCSVPRTTIRTLFNSAMSLDCHSRRSDLSRRMSPIPFGNTRQAPTTGAFFFRRQFIRITAKAIGRVAIGERRARRQPPRSERRSHLSQTFDLPACDAFEVGARSGRVSQIRPPFDDRFPRYTSGT